MAGTTLETLDWIVILIYTVAVIALGMMFVRRGSKNVEAFFVAGRSLPWWLAGTSIVATNFACDTPLYVTDLVRRYGIQGSCFEWAGSWGVVITVFVTGRLLRRSALVTDVQLAEFRYGGRPGTILRVFQSGYYALLFNTLVLGWVLAAMSFWAEEVLGINRYAGVIGSAVLALSYASVSGLWGVVATDLFQFIVATGGAITLAVISVNHVGGIGEMVTQLRSLPGWEGQALNIWPRQTPSMGWTLILAYFGLQWMFGANPLLYSAQRVLACKSDKDTSLAIVWNVLARHILNLWPWIIVALCSLLIFPVVEDNQMVYPKMVTTLLPVGLRGLMIAAILAAFMSSVDTALNWASSYVINDVYRPFVVKDASERHYVWISRLSMCAMAAVGVIFGLMFESIIDRLQFAAGMIISFSSVLVLRWFWWRINAWSEIAAVTTSAVTALTIDRLVPQWSGPEQFGVRLFTIMALTAVVWLAVTFLTKPADMDTLKKFYRRVRPIGFWGPVKAQLEPHELTRSGWPPWYELVFSCAACAAIIYCAMVGAGKLILGQWAHGMLLAGAAFLAWLFVYRQLGRMDECAAQEHGSAD